jgi:hypothetical protein
LSFFVSVPSPANCVCDLGHQQKKPGAFAPGFFFAAEGNEISNLDLIRDIDRIIKLEEALSIIKY